MTISNREDQSGCLSDARQLVALALAASLSMMIALPSQAQPFPPTGVADQLLPKRYAYDLVVTSVPPPPYRENEPIPVTYKLTARQQGFVGTLPAPLANTSMCGNADATDCKPIGGALRVGRIIQGTVNATAVAGANSRFSIVLVDAQKNLLGDATFSGPVAARYFISLDKFTIHHTRARTTDTVFVAGFSGKVAGQRSSAPDACQITGTGAPVYCVQEKPQGDHRDGTYPIVDARIGPFDLIPDIDPDLNFAFVLSNNGTSYEQRVFNQVMDSINDLTLAAATTAVSMGAGETQGKGQGSGGWQGLHDWTGKLQDMISGGCDGPVAADGKTLLNKSTGSNAGTLAALTASSGRWGETSKIYEMTSQNGCGNNSKYTVEYSIQRTSWKPAAP